MNTRNIHLCLTPYQLFVSYTYSKYVHDKYGEKSDIVYMQSYGEILILKDSFINFISLPNLNTNVFSKLWQRLYYSGRLFLFSPLHILLQGFDEYNVFIYNDYYPIINNFIRHAKKKNSRIILIEEGIGTYSSSNKTRSYSIKNLLRCVFMNILGSPMNYKAIGESNEITHVIVDNVPLYKSKPCSQKQILLKQNKSAVFSCSKSFINATNENIIHKSSYDLLFLGGPLSEDFKLIEEESNYLDNLFLPLLEKKVNIIVKPHPREKISKYRRFRSYDTFTLLEGVLQTMPIECVMISLTIRAVAAFISSASVNIAEANPQLPVIITYKMDIAKDLFNKFQKIYDDDYDGIFKSSNNNIYFVKNHMGLLSILESSKLNIKSDSNICCNDTDKILFPEMDYFYSKSI